MVVTDNDDHAEAMRRFRNHGIAADHRVREERGTWFYEMDGLGYNYRLTDIQSALGMSQLSKLPAWLDRRRAIASQYDRDLAGIDGISPLGVRADRRHAYHLYVVRVDPDGPVDRDSLFGEMRERGIGVNVHYIPVHMHPYYRDRFPDLAGTFPIADGAYAEILSLPMHQGLTTSDTDWVVGALRTLTAGE